MLGDLQDAKHEVAVLLGNAAFLTALAAVDTEKGVTSATPGPAAVFESERFVKTGQGFPVVEVIGIRSTYSSESQAKFAVHEVHIVWTHVGDDEQTITAQLERLVRATRDVLWPLLGPVTLPIANSGPLEVVSEEYSQLMPAQGHPFVKGAVTVLHVPTYVV
jgi:hypothetical protein